MDGRFTVTDDASGAADGNTHVPSSDADHVVSLRSSKRLELKEAVQLLQSFVDTIAKPSQLNGLAVHPNAPSTMLDRAVLVKLAKAEINNRRRRMRFFGRAIFGEPAWDMLLILYIESDRSRVTARKLCRACGAAPTTALRWLDYLQSQRLISRAAHPTDRRASSIEITNKAMELMDSYLAEIFRGGE